PELTEGLLRDVHLMNPAARLKHQYFRHPLQRMLVIVEIVNIKDRPKGSCRRLSRLSRVYRVEVNRKEKHLIGEALRSLQPLSLFIGHETESKFSPQTL